VSSGAVEACNGVDEDCDGEIDEGFTDTDGDSQADCVDEDDDADTFLDIIDCGPTNPEVYPNAVEQCDGVDNNCDTLVDENFANTDGDLAADCVDDDDDDDGDADGTDCAPLEPKQAHGLVEQCDGLDNDCNGLTDEGCAPVEVMLVVFEAVLGGATEKGALQMAVGQPAGGGRSSSPNSSYVIDWGFYPVVLNP
jgi:hypothetical protein